MGSIHELRYQRFLATRPKRDLVREAGYELHHIQPLSLGGKDISENLIKLTCREHFIAHLILWKIYGGKMSLAFRLLATTPRTKQRLTSRQFESLRKEIHQLEQEKIVAISTRQKISSSLMGNKRHKGKLHSSEAKKKMSSKHKGLQAWNKGKPCTWKRKQVRCIETGEIYDSALVVIKQFNKKGLYGHLSGDQPSYNGFHWEYI